jgi:hypothetical protein
MGFVQFGAWSWMGIIHIFAWNMNTTALISLLNLRAVVLELECGAGEERCFAVNCKILALAVRLMMYLVLLSI